MSDLKTRIELQPAAKWLKTFWHAIELNEQALTLYRGEKSLVIPWQEIIAMPSVDRKLGFTRVLIQTTKQVYLIAGLKRKMAEETVSLMVKPWILHHQNALKEFTEELRTFLLQPVFLKASQWGEFTARLQNLRQLIPQVRPNPQDQQSMAVYDQATSMIEKSGLLFDEARHHYVQKALTQYETLFDQIESQPLTQQQRIACVIHDDYNLVLAGAGTGKTSTIVAKVAFLLESQQAKPEEILLLAFAKKAQEEMQERLNSRGIHGVAVHTFHSLGLSILRMGMKKPPELSPMSENMELRRGFVTERFQTLIKNRQYRHDLLHYLQRWDIPTVRDSLELEAETPDDFKTLQGESVEHAFIARVADYLYQTGIQYQLNATYQQQSLLPDGEIYIVDLYLPKADLYIDVERIDLDGLVPDHLLEKNYREKLVWKRSVHQHFHTNYQLISASDQQSTFWLQRLERFLEEIGIKRKHKSEKSLLEQYQQRAEFLRIPHLLTDLLTQMRSAHLSPEVLNQRISESRSPEQIAAMMSLVIPIHEHYENRLLKEGTIDFDDMITKSKLLVDSDKFKPVWQHILIDEFQDISEPRAELIRALLQKAENSTLFAVGDDWQSIYRFAGSDVRLTTRFESTFGVGQITCLDKTFRFNNQIHTVASRFVLKNPEQIEKNMTTHQLSREPEVCVCLTENQNETLLEAVESLSDVIGNGSTLYILARFHSQLPNEEMRNTLNRQYPSFVFQYDTVHASKGKEADIVIVLGLNSVRFGFPAQLSANPFVNVLLPKAEDFPYAEERRLFYVALTRARHKVILIGNEAKPSVFLTELIKQRYPIKTSL